MSNSFIWPIDKTLSGATTLGQSGPRSDDKEGALCIPQSSSITGTSLSDCFMSYQDTHWGGLTLFRDAVGIFYSSSQLSFAIWKYMFRIYK